MTLPPSSPGTFTTAVVPRWLADAGKRGRGLRIPRCTAQEIKGWTLTSSRCRRWIGAIRSYDVDQLRWLQEATGLKHAVWTPTWDANWVPHPGLKPSEHIGRVLSGQTVAPCGRPARPASSTQGQRRDLQRVLSALPPHRGHRKLGPITACASSTLTSKPSTTRTDSSTHAGNDPPAGCRSIESAAR